jgi:hypothetical protein
MTSEAGNRFLLPSAKHIKKGIFFLDRMRHVEEAITFQELLEEVITRREKSRVHLDPLPSNVKIPLASESFWAYLLGLGKASSNRTSQSLKRMSLKSRECVVHLLEYLELLYLVHKLPFEDINDTFLYFGNIINTRLNERRKLKIVMDREFCTFEFSMDDIKDSITRPPGNENSTPPMSLSILEWIVNYVQAQEEKSSASGMHVASIRSVFIESRPKILTYIWPSIMHFQSFPKEKQLYIIPIIPWVRLGGLKTSLSHATLAVATVDAERRTGILELYDPSFNPDNELNLQSVLNGLIECEVGGVQMWRLADSKKDRFYAAPAQSINMCVAACSCFCLWKSGTDGFQDWGTDQNLTLTSVENWWRYRQLVCHVVKDYVQQLDQSGQIHWKTDKKTGLRVTDPSLLYKFPSMKPRNKLFSSNTK